MGAPCHAAAPQRCSASHTPRRCCDTPLRKVAAERTALQRLQRRSVVWHTATSQRCSPKYNGAAPGSCHNYAATPRCCVAVSPTTFHHRGGRGSRKREECFNYIDHPPTPSTTTGGGSAGTLSPTPAAPRRGAGSSPATPLKINSKLN